MKREQLENYLRKRPIIQAPENLHPSLMEQIYSLPSPIMKSETVLPEKALLILSLFTGIAVLIFVLDINPLMMKLSQVVAFLVHHIKENQSIVTRFAIILEHVPSLMLILAVSVPILIAIDKLFITKTSRLVKFVW